MNKKLIIGGHARHGKDTVAEMLGNFGYTYQTSSYAAMEEFLYDQLKGKYGYTSMQECFADRINHRQEWYDAIRTFNKYDEARLGRIIFSKYDIYCGIRSQVELEQLKAAKVFDYFIWVDASKRHPLESPKSMSVTEQPDYVIDNNGTLWDLTANVLDFMKAAEIY